MRWTAALALLSVSGAGCIGSTDKKANNNVADCSKAATQMAKSTGCPTDVEIVATEYAFLPPAEIHAGPVTFRFVNKGRVRHELNIARLKTGVSIDEYLDSVRADKSVQNLIDGPVGVLFADPGAKSAAGLSVDLRPGEQYSIICIFKDAKDAKRHYDLGMYKVMHVTGAQQEMKYSLAAIDTIVATEYAFQYPRSVEPGRHTFVFRNEGKMRHELDIALLKKNVTLARLREVEKTGANVDSLFEPMGFGLLHARSGVTPLGELTVDMIPGREYVIACFFKDTDKSPEHYELGMFGSIVVSPRPTT